MHLPGEGAITGHLDGVVTLDLAETDDRHRDELRRSLGEPFRTVIGHLRHEVGHHFWRTLVDGTAELGRFRSLFGDERRDYRSAIEAHYAGAAPVVDPAAFVTVYATAHPFEDWAETFAHLLHIGDATDTAVAHGLVAAPGAGVVGLLDAWGTGKRGPSTRSRSPSGRRRCIRRPPRTGRRQAHVRPRPDRRRRAPGGGPVLRPDHDPMSLDAPLGSPSRPSWRGGLHLIALLVAVPLLVALTIVVSGARARIGVIVYALGLCTMLTVSTVYHRWVHTIRARRGGGAPTTRPSSPPWVGP